MELFFYPNACHVCRKYGKDAKLKRCSNCMMIAYCSREHQREHWQAHKDVCKSVAPVVKKLGSIFIPNKDRVNMDAISWRTFKEGLAVTVQRQLKRQLLSYEKAMFLLPRSCPVCYETDHKKLIDCPNCPATSFCHDHANTEHEEICKLTRLCFEIETGPFQLLNEVPLVNIGTEVPKDLQGIMEGYRSLHEKQKISIPLEIWTVLMAECLSAPYTFLHAVQKLSLDMRASTTFSMNIHVVGSELVEMNNIHCWEILFHHLKFLTNVVVTFIGPNLNFHEGEFNIALSKNCPTKFAQLRMRTVNRFYHDYVISELYTKPDFIIGFNLALFDIEFPQDSWSTTIQKIKNEKCPFFLTSHTLTESQADHMKINRVLKKDVKFVHFGENPYRSMKPFRDHGIDHFYYQNQYLTIYEEL